MPLSNKVSGRPVSDSEDTESVKKAQKSETSGMRLALIGVGRKYVLQASLTCRARIACDDSIPIPPSIRSALNLPLSSAAVGTPTPHTVNPVARFDGSTASRYSQIRDKIA
jgi:hypothetical protein